LGGKIEPGKAYIILPKMRKEAIKKGKSRVGKN